MSGLIGRVRWDNVGVLVLVVGALALTGVRACAGDPSRERETARAAPAPELPRLEVADPPPVAEPPPPPRAKKRRPARPPRRRARRPARPRPERPTPSVQRAVTDPSVAQAIVEVPRPAPPRPLPPAPEDEFAP